MRVTVVIHLSYVILNHNYWTLQILAIQLFEKQTDTSLFYFLHIRAWENVVKNTYIYNQHFFQLWKLKEKDLQII